MQQYINWMGKYDAITLYTIQQENKKNKSQQQASMRMKLVTTDKLIRRVRDYLL